MVSTDSNSSSSAATTGSTLTTTALQTNAAAANKPPASILDELKFFIRCVSAQHKLPADVADQLVKCSLHLLHELPAAREVVFEYFAMSFDCSVGQHMQGAAASNTHAANTNDKGANASAAAAAAGAAASDTGNNDDETIVDIQDALAALVAGGPHAWVPLISTWALRLLGTLSHKFARGRPRDIAGSCSLWLASPAMRCLLGLAASCFHQLDSAETEECIGVLLGTYVQHSPHFDWVVARLGGSFPLKVISK